MISEEILEEELKKRIFDKICEIQDINQKTITKVPKIAHSAGIKINQPTNISRTAMNKLIIDIVPRFNEAGIKFYSKSVVSQAIYIEMLEYIKKGNILLRKFCECLTPDVEESQWGSKGKGHQNTNDKMKPSNKVSRFWAKLRNIFVMPNILKTNVSDEDKEAAKAYMTEYEELEQELWNYNIRDSIVPALVRIICPKEGFIYLATAVPALIDEEVAPILQKLGMGDLISELEEALVAEYTKNESDRLEHSFSKDAIDLCVPNFRKYREEKRTKSDLPKDDPIVNDEETQNAIATDGIEPGDD